MPTRRVVVQLVVALCVMLSLCSTSNLSDLTFTDDVNSTRSFTVNPNATDFPDITQQDFGPRAITDVPAGSTVGPRVTQTAQTSDGETHFYT